MSDQELNLMQEEYVHFGAMLNHASAGHVPVDAARRRVLDFMGDSDPAERARMRKEHLTVPDREFSYTVDELFAIGNGRQAEADAMVLKRTGIKP